MVTHRRARGRGWWHRGEHHRRRGALSVEDIRQSLNPPAPRRPPVPGEAVYLGSILTGAKVYGVMTDGDGVPLSAVLTIEPPGDAVTSLAALMGPQTVTFDAPAPLYMEMPTEPLAIQAGAGQ